MLPTAIEGSDGIGRACLGAHPRLDGAIERTVQTALVVHVSHPSGQN